MHPPGDPLGLHAAPRGARLRASLEELRAERHGEALAAAYARGLEDGRRETLESGAAALLAVVERVDAAADRAQEELARQSVELAVEIARTLVGLRIDAGEYDLETIVRGALSDSGVGRGACVVHLNPEDHARLEGVLFRSGTELCVDPSLARGDVHLSTPRGLLVREMEATLEAIREQLLEEVAR